MVRVTRNTLGAILDIFDEHVEAADSEGDLFRGHNNIRAIRVEFADRRLGNRRAGVFSHTGTWVSMIFQSMGFIKTLIIRRSIKVV